MSVKWCKQKHFTEQIWGNSQGDANVAFTKEKKNLKENPAKHKLNITYTDLNRRCLFEFISIEKQLHEHCRCM